MTYEKQRRDLNDSNYTREQIIDFLIQTRKERDLAKEDKKEVFKCNINLDHKYFQLKKDVNRVVRNMRNYDKQFKHK